MPTIHFGIALLRVIKKNAFCVPTQKEKENCYQRTRNQTLKLGFRPQNSFCFWWNMKGGIHNKWPSLLVFIASNVIDSTKYDVESNLHWWIDIWVSTILYPTCPHNQHSFFTSSKEQQHLVILLIEWLVRLIFSKKNYKWGHQVFWSLKAWNWQSICSVDFYD